MKEKYLIKISLLLLLLIPVTSNAQYAPAAGQHGSTAIYKDSSIIKAWASDCIVQRGYINITDTNQTYTQDEITSNIAFFGEDSFATGPANGIMDVVSLGDGGSAILTFNNAIINAEGADFVVFENGLKSQAPPYNFFLELAFVEVSSNGIDYVRFPSVSLTQTSIQIEGFDQLDPEKIHNLAGKYEVNYGTPFDLQDLIDSTNINLDSIVYVKIIDVVGNINNPFASFDSQGNTINDPWSTPFWSCGFDLDAIGVIHHKETNSIDHIYANNNSVSVYPNPIASGDLLNIKFNNDSESLKKISILSTTGKLIYHEQTTENTINISSSIFSNQLYILQIETEKNIIRKKIIIQY